MGINSRHVVAAHNVEPRLVKISQAKHVRIPGLAQVAYVLQIGSEGWRALSVSKNSSPETIFSHCVRRLNQTQASGTLALGICSRCELRAFKTARRSSSSFRYGSSFLIRSSFTGMLKPRATPQLVAVEIAPAVGRLLEAGVVISMQ